MSILVDNDAGFIPQMLANLTGSLRTLRVPPGSEVKKARSWTAAILLTLVSASLVAGCGSPADMPGDFVSGSDLCMEVLSEGAAGIGAITSAGWSPDPVAPDADATAGSQRYSKGPLSLVVAGPRQGRCFVDGEPSKVGSFQSVNDSLSAKFGPATKETRATYRWQAKDKALLVKLSQTNTARGEILRIYVFRPSPDLIEGVGR